LNRLKCTAVAQAGWEAKAVLGRELLVELHWWLATLRANEAASIQAFEPTKTIYTDASETGWGGSITKEKELEEIWMFGWWTKEKAEMVNCLRELEAVEKVLNKAWTEGHLKEGEDVMIYTDNTNVEYNLNKKKSGWRMRAKVKQLILWLKERQIRIECHHVAGAENGTADALSRLAKSGDYSLKTGVIRRIEKGFREEAEIDLFANGKNKQKEMYCSVKKDRKAMARDAMTISWSGKTALAHPPIPMVVRTLLKVKQDKARVILVVPFWRGQIWTKLLNEMKVKGPMVLGRCEKMLQAGTSMKTVNASLPPGLLAAYVLQG
jgi:hypothetical protein